MSETSTKINIHAIAKGLFLDVFDKCNSQSDFLDFSDLGHKKLYLLFGNLTSVVIESFNKKWVRLWMESSKKNTVHLDTIGKLDIERKKVFAVGDNKKIKRFINQFHDQAELDKSFTHSCRKNNLEIVKFLCEEKNCMGHLLYDDLIVAIENKAYEVMLYLVQEDADININNGATFYKACQTNDEKVKCLVLGCGYDLNKFSSSVSQEDYDWAQSYLNSKNLHKRLGENLKSTPNQKKQKI